MILDFDSICQDHGIVSRNEGHSHCREGWIQVKCPFCSGHDGWHLGFEYATGRFSCWRCGRHRDYNVLVALLDTTKDETQRLLRKYQLRPSQRDSIALTELSGTCELPVGAEQMNDRHKQYLAGRGFDPNKIEAEWGLLGVGPVGPYKHRIVAPIYLHRQMVSWQTRDITGKAQAKYITCATSNSIVNPKHTLYGIDRANTSTVVVVEGIADVWRLGYGAVATLGIKFTTPQVMLLRQYKHVCVVFDFDEPAALTQAERLAHTLESFCRVELIECVGVEDPGSMKQSDADELMNELLKGK